VLIVTLFERKIMMLHLNEPNLLLPFIDGQDRCNETWDGLKRTIYGAFTNITQVRMNVLN